MFIYNKKLVFTLFIIIVVEGRGYRGLASITLYKSVPGYWR